VDKLYFWALRILRPQISGYIDQWCHRHIDGTCTQRSILTQEQNSDISEIVGRVKHRLSTLSISKPRLEDLLSQIVIQKELLLQFKSLESSADTPSSVSNNNDPPLNTVKQPLTRGKKSGFSEGCTPARSGRKSAPANLITSEWKPDSPVDRRIEDHSRSSSDTRINRPTYASSNVCDTRMPLEDRLCEYGQSIQPVGARPRPGTNLSAKGNTTASEISPGASNILPMRIFTPEESELAGPLTPPDRVSASRNPFRGYPAWVYGDTPPRSGKGSFEETFHFEQPTAGTSVGRVQKPIAHMRTRPRNTSHADHLKKLEGFTGDAAARGLKPITPPLRSPFQPVEDPSIRQEAHGGGHSRRDSRALRHEGGEDWQTAIEIPGSQSECFELDM
jgi:hypothetical protein